MKAVIQHRFGGPEILSYEDVPDPVCAPDEVIVDVHAVSVNTGLDFSAREGSYARPVTLPHILGVDPSGIISETGGEVTGWAVGDRVWVDFFIACGRCSACAQGKPRLCAKTEMLGVTRHGGYAQRVAVPARNLHRVPESVPFPVATVVARHFPLAMYLIEQRASVRAGERVLVMGATGGLGNACVQIARTAGAVVIAAVGSAQRAAAALDAGAQHAIDYRSGRLLDAVLEITAGRGVDVVCENVGDPTLWGDAFDSLAQNGRMVTAGAHAGGHVNLNIHRLYLRRLSILGGADVPPDGVARALTLAETGKVRPGIARLTPLANAAEAHRLVAAREVTGKIVLDPTATP